MKKRGFAVAAVLLAAVLVAVIVGDFLFSREFSADFQAMNTVVSISASGVKAEKAVEEIKEEIIRLDEKLLSRTNENSELCAVNCGSAQASDEMKTILTELKQLEVDCGGAFCVGLAELSDLWGIGTAEARLPAQAEISAAIKNVKNWQINGNAVALPEGVRLDLGAAGKGIACDYARDILSASGCKQAVVAVGGSVLLYGGEEFKVGIRDPLGQANEHCMILETGAACVSTSGNYERFFRAQDGRIYHHIFDPSTGYPADKGLLSVTVAAENGCVSDALSTACFVLGVEESMPLLEKYNADAVFITADKQIITTYENEEEIITVTNDDYSFGDVQ